MDDNSMLFTSSADSEDTLKPNNGSTAGHTSVLRSILASFNGMHHAFAAFFIPIAIMMLIYIAIQVWPFGNNSVLVLDLNGQYA